MHAAMQGTSQCDNDLRADCIMYYVVYVCTVQLAAYSPDVSAGLEFRVHSESSKKRVGFETS